MHIWHVFVALEKHCPPQKSDKHRMQGAQNNIWLFAVFHEPKFWYGQMIVHLFHSNGRGWLNIGRCNNCNNNNNNSKWNSDRVLAFSVFWLVETNAIGL